MHMFGGMIKQGKWLGILVGISSSALCQNLDDNIRENSDPTLDLEAGGLNINIAPSAPDLPKNIKVKANYFRWVNAKQHFKYEGLVQVLGDNGLQMYADRAELDLNEKSVRVTGNVEIYQGSVVYRGDSARYFYEIEKLDTKDLVISIDPVLLKADSVKQIERKGRDVFIARDAAITTHDVEKPNYWVEADKITIYPKEKVTLKNMRLKAGDKTVFWLPYLSQSLDKDLGYHFTPGARSNWGAFLLNRYGVMLGGDYNEETEERENAWLLAQFLFDIRYERGFGTGVDFFDTRLEDNDNLGWLKFYYLNDLDPSQRRLDEPRGFVNEDRYRVEFKNRFEHESLARWAGDDARVFTDINLTWLSDRFYLEDFEPGTFTTNPSPDNTIGLYRQTENSLSGLYGRFKINDFYQADSRLPELFFESVRRPIKNSKIFYQGSTSAGLYREDLADFTRAELAAERDARAAIDPTDPLIADINTQIEQREFLRFHTWHELSRTFRPVDGVTITPRAGIGFTQYWQEGADDESFNRRLLYVGLDSSLKFVKNYPDIVNKKWGVDGLQHVVQPYTNISVLSANELDGALRGIDRLTATTRLRSIDVGSFAAIDEINSWGVVRQGVYNELLTRRDGGSHPWLTVNTYFDHFITDPEGDRNFSNLYNDIYWYPLPWMAASIETQFPVFGGGSDFTEVAPGVRFMPNEDWEVELNYRYLDGHPTLDDSSRLDARVYTRINESWGIDVAYQWELDDNTLETQQYKIYRDFDSWIASIGILNRNNRTSNEFSILLGFTLKEFPAVDLPLTIDQAEN